MYKKIFLLALVMLFCRSLYGQAVDSVYDRYLDFNLARFQGENDKIKELGEALVPEAGKLPEKARINFYFAIGKMYEDDGQPKKAAPFYEKVTVAVPDYYVAHRALGYIYLDEVKVIETRLDAAINNPVEHQRLYVSYISAVKKTLLHLEKAQACDPSDETLTIINLLYNNTNDVQGLNSLYKRLKVLSKSCIDILNDR